jgi:hypothetical protein
VRPARFLPWRFGFLIALRMGAHLDQYQPLIDLDKERGNITMLTERDLLTNTHKAFNARDIGAALATMHPDVDWPNGMEGGYEHGHNAVRDYWTRQWGVIDPYVEPLRFDADEAGRIVVNVYQVIRDWTGNVIKDQMVQHVYQIRDGLIRSMEIRKP